MMRPLLPLLAAALFMSAAPLAAHPSIMKVTPTVNATVKSPADLRILFSEAVMAPLSGIALTGPGGRVVKTGKASTAQDGRELIVPVSGKLAPGTYHAKWHIVSSDTHRVEGHFAFTVQ